MSLFFTCPRLPHFLYSCVCVPSRQRQRLPGPIPGGTMELPWKFLYGCLHIHIHICIYVHIYIHIHTHIYIYIDVLFVCYSILGVVSAIYCIVLITVKYFAMPDGQRDDEKCPIIYRLLHSTLDCCVLFLIKVSVWCCVHLSSIHCSDCTILRCHCLSRISESTFFLLSPISVGLSWQVLRHWCKDNFIIMQCALNSS